MIPLSNTAKKHLLNFPGKKLDKKIVVFESDDWGGERIPSVRDLKFLTSCGIDIYANPFNHLDSLETEDDLSALFETLRRYKDRKGNYPVITANCVSANPDFEKIRESGFREYHYENMLHTYKRKKECMNSYALIKEGMSAGVFHPQFHGREHLNVKQWIHALQSGNEVLRKVFNAGIYGIDFNNELTNKTYFMAASNSNTKEDLNEYRNIIKEGTSLFKDIFGYTSRSFIAPSYIWHPSVEVYLKENGVKYIQGLPIQYAPVSDDRYRKIYHYQGQRNKKQQVYFIRNCFFEPALNPRHNLIDECLRRLKIIFFWKKPAIIGTHRINFIGSLNEKNRKQNLKNLSVLLKKILEIWPDVEFLTTDKLGELY